MTGNSYYFRKLHSLLGVIPVGFFLIEHLLTNYSATKGPAEFVAQIEWLNNLPLVLFLEIFGIWIPLLYHGVYGLYVAYQARNNVSNYGYFRNQMFFLQRVTGVITFIFIAWHVFQTRVQVAVGSVEHAELGGTMHDIATNPWWFAFYLVGVLAASFHFSNGMWSFLVSWGITVGPRAQRISTIVWLGVFVIMSVLFILSLVAFTSSDFADTAAAIGTYIGNIG
ncbi:succinate dehydrogenase cytochrome b558 subunit [Paenibacillus eucommiae]|uniref:Succinate dehydrogenase / fumarate reductase cytochrome b subunit n=1 Tax=Paenibacillus eucommiae TaxID=1355755 RepID=A0ABS4IWM7_9BACL|nr:succinate dehydrogenase cytochrome b558 subunit [Paenibacillus eucommiae]MBP1991992.1 succinate dehydrogenase / fumarate reductase cytochrome b subunit [Paenibacillus eucommiae]